MNRFEGPGAREAQVRYLDADFQVLSPGTFVRCAATGQPIALDELRYWNAERQEAYANAEASLTRHLQLHGRRHRAPAPPIGKH